MHRLSLCHSLCQRPFRGVLGGVILVALWVSQTVSPSVVAAEPGRAFLAADSSKGRIALIDEKGATTWEYKIGPLHDLHLLPSGNVLFQKNWTHLIEVNPANNQIVWEYDCANSNGNAGKKLEVHAFERLASGNTMIAESGVSRIIEVDPQGKLVNSIPLQVSKPHPHRDTRLVRVLENGDYLVCHEGDGIVRQYARDGSTRWEFAVPMFDRQPRGGHGVEAFGNQCFTAIRLANGNTLISTGNGHSVLEVSPEKEIIWKLEQNDLPGIQLAWVTTVQELKNGNIFITNCHAGPSNPQLIEVTRDKKVVWQMNDFERFGDALSNAVAIEK